VITGAHTVIYSEDAAATRAFLLDVLELDAVDAGGGWLIFALPPGEAAVHPGDVGGRQELYLLCDDIDATVLALSAKGVVFTGPIHDERWGRVTALQVPGAGSLGLYEPRHARP
jgi:catechol 2,3-dioxygenase-like lactoylglutathione lyase family enzyme